MKRLITRMFFAVPFIANLAVSAQLNNISFQNNTIPTPLSGLSVEYDIFGTSPVAEAEIRFSLSGDNNPNTGIALASRRVSFRCGRPPSPCLPPIGRQTQFFSGFAIQEQARNVLGDIQNSCTTESVYIVGRLDGDVARVSNSPAIVGTVKLPDFLFDSGTITPATTTTNGSISIDYSVRTICRSPNLPGVGVYLTDAAFTPLVFFGSVGVTGPFGSSHSIGLSLNGIGLPPGNYNIVLVADVTQIVSESNEDNNLGSFSLGLTSSLQNDVGNSSSQELLNSIPLVDFIDRTPDISYMPDFNSSYIDTTNRIKVYKNTANAPLNPATNDSHKVMRAFKLKITE